MKSRVGYQQNTVLRRTPPSANSLAEGQIVFALNPNRGLSMYTKRKGQLWETDFYKKSDKRVIDQLEVRGETKVLKNLTVRGNISGGQVSFFNHNYNTNSANLRYVPWGSVSEDSSINYYNNIIAPYSGRLLKVLVRCNTDIDTVIVGFHKSPDETEAPNSTATETITLEMGTDDTTTEFNFTPTSVFDKGDVIAISIDPENTANDVKVTSAWLFNILI